MGSRSSNLRTKVVALLASLVALWSFTAWVTIRDGVNLLGVQALDSKVFNPTEPLLLQLQLERRTSLTFLGRPDDGQRAALAEVRQRTDQLAAEFTESIDSWQVAALGSDTLDQRLDELVGGLDELSATRTAVDDKSIDRAEAGGAFTELIESIYRVYDALGNLDDEQAAEDTAALIGLNRARELLSQEDALLAGVLAAGRITPAERAEFTRIVGARQFTAAQSIVRLPAADQRRYDQMSTGETFRRLADLENQVMQSDAGTRPPVEAAEWNDTTGPALTEIGDVVLAGGDDIVDRATPIAIGVIVRLVLAAGLGLLAVVASIIVSITTARALVRQLERLREAAFRLANERLPSVVERLGHGEEVDVAKEAPPLEFGDDEIGQVGKAFNAVQETAIRTAVEQAELRRNVREVFLSLARRTQALVHRQLTLLDAMERREQDAEELEDLFRVDHLATRMRRNAENLIVLSGSTPGRAWRRNVPMVDVVRGAVAEVEDYTRVNVLPLGPVSLTGRAVGDVIHLLAELIENGLSFSPPHTTVEVRGQMVANGFAIEIEDRGLGMSEEDLAAANHRIVDQSELNLANAARLGLYVVSRLTERHGIRVQLKESAYGGTTAVVLIPADLVTADDADPSTSGGFPVGAPAAAPAVTAGPAAPAGEQPPAPLVAPVALAEPPVVAEPAEPAPVATVGGDGGADDGGAGEGDGGADGGLPTRTRGRSLPAGEDPLPTRARRWSEQAALDGPTFPTGLPMAAARSDLDAAPTGSPAGPPPAGEVAPATDGGPEAAVPQPRPARTDSGLPVRVRQANIVPELRDEPAAPDDDEDVVRPPEQVRRMMSSYQTGTRRGRTDAARLLGGPGARPDSGPDPDEQQAT
ncbi:nitrate- and nitrite sensing domain-containing protein [Micromonospora sp. C28SCA-DRY-2]|uniref:sensor histidine kinase n=1 Tax=Micromonospora sp. C28SCA-DRY-2 TaxID=3059522 RepID=UPI00267461CE|nr:nitrate- and nitrite sensing domain-containing protein [Micromonospora sp. C28SCA-DRY-2]MDO3703457.1 nitrate- and nitrite sensing domain-containing protein [Micromonospora sp. C28SCA-DRY-2]